MDRTSDMDGGYVPLVSDCGLSAPITNTTTLRTYAAPSAGWRLRRFGYSNWRDPHRQRSSRRIAFFSYKFRIRMQQGNK
jgi:hypothetical protein